MTVIITDKQYQELLQFKEERNKYRLCLEEQVEELKDYLASTLSSNLCSIEYRRSLVTKALIELEELLK